MQPPRLIRRPWQECFVGRHTGAILTPAPQEAMESCGGDEVLAELGPSEAEYSQ
jgi:hypothetical protein